MRANAVGALALGIALFATDLGRDGVRWRTPTASAQIGSPSSMGPLGASAAWLAGKLQPQFDWLRSRAEAVRNWVRARLPDIKRFVGTLGRKAKAFISDLIQQSKAYWDKNWDDTYCNRLVGALSTPMTTIISKVAPFVAKCGRDFTIGFACNLPNLVESIIRTAIKIPDYIDKVSQAILDHQSVCLAVPKYVPIVGTVWPALCGIFYVVKDAVQPLTCLASTGEFWSTVLDSLGEAACREVGGLVFDVVLEVASLGAATPLVIARWTAKVLKILRRLTGTFWVSKVGRKLVKKLVGRLTGRVPKEIRILADDLDKPLSGINIDQKMATALTNWAVGVATSKCTGKLPDPPPFELLPEDTGPSPTREATLRSGSIKIYAYPRARSHKGMIQQGSKIRYLPLPDGFCRVVWGGTGYAYCEDIRRAEMPSVDSSPGKTGKLKNASRLRLRSAENGSSNVLLMLTSSDRFTIYTDLSRRASWCRVKHGRVEGWAACSHLQYAEPNDSGPRVGTPEVRRPGKLRNARRLFVRSKPGTSGGSKVLHELRPGHSFTIHTALSLGETWCQVRYGSIDGFSACKFLAYADGGGSASTGAPRQSPSSSPAYERRPIPGPGRPGKLRNARRLFVRSKPGTSGGSKVLHELRPSHSFTIHTDLSLGEKWCQVRYGSIDGFSACKFLAYAGSSLSSSRAPSSRSKSSSRPTGAGSFVSSRQPAFGSNYSRPSYGRSKGSSYSKSSFGRSRTSSYSKSSFGRSRTSSYSKSSFGRSRTSSYSKSSFGSSPKSSYSRSSYGRSPKTTYSKPSFASSRKSSYSKPSFGSFPKSSYSRSSYGRSPKTTYSKPSFASSRKSSSLSPSPTSSSVGGARATVRAARLQLRSGPSAGASVILTLSRGNPVTLLRETRGDYCKVSYRGRIGWASCSYLSSAPSSASTRRSPTGASYRPSTSYRRYR